jgi:hypothetical protein
MATCAVMGQAVGTAAAMCVRERVDPRELGRRSIKSLQQQLLRDDAYIIGVANEDEDDLARGSEVRASSEKSQGPATNVINGITRGVGADSNRWISDPDQKGNPWLELRLDSPQKLRKIILTFDTGLNRPLTLTHSERFNARMIRGPQPETVRDYEVQLLAEGKPVRSVRIDRNVARRRTHLFEPATADAVRLIVHGTNGDPPARLFEIRLYA